MGYAVEILFDSESENKISDLLMILKSKGIKNRLLEFGTTPHICLSVSDDIDADKAIEMLKNITVPSLNIYLYGLGTFSGPNNIFFLLPKVTMDLLTFHSALHQQISEFSEPWAYYCPGNWTPHCTIAMDIANDKFSQAFHLIHEKLEPISAEAAKIRLIEFHPERILFERII